jgi:lipoprotein-anchoring transpeptidase ErfK/SrfK
MKGFFRNFKVIKAAMAVGLIIIVVLVVRFEGNISFTTAKNLGEVTLIGETEGSKKEGQTINKEAKPEATAKLEDKTPEIEKKDNKSVDSKQAENEKVKEEVKEEKKTVYKLNDKGEGVLELQKKLNKFGYKLSLDGVFGNSTYFAVSNFQQMVGLKADGIAGPATMEKLNLAPTEALMYKPKAEPPSQSGKGENAGANPETFINSQNAASSTQYYIWVDTDNFRVNIFIGSKNNWKLVKSMKCSIGKNSTPTVKGNFKIGSRGPMFRVDSKIICKYYTQFKGNYLFHSVLLNNDGKVVDGRLGMKISHGCIRLAIEDAKYIYENIPTSTAVWVK